MKRALAALSVASVLLATAATDVSGATANPRAVAPAHMCIVSLSPTATETLFAIGAGPNVEAVDTDSNYPAAAKAIATRIDPFNPNAEQIATVCRVTRYHKTSKPDLVVIAYDANSIQQKLSALGIKVELQDAPAKLAGAYAQMVALGTWTGHKVAAVSLVSRIKRSIAADVLSVAPHPRKVLTTYYELDPTLYSLTSATFVGQLMASLGIKDIADAVDQPSDGGYPQLTAEYLITQSPKLVFLADTVCCKVTPTSFGQRTGFSTISAVRFGHVAGLNDDIASRWGPRLSILMLDLTRAVKSALADPRPWRK